MFCQSTTHESIKLEIEYKRSILNVIAVLGLRNNALLLGTRGAERFGRIDAARKVRRLVVALDHF